LRTRSPTAGTEGGRLGEPVRTQIDRLAAQIDALQARLDALISHRSEAVAERASRHVASIVAAAEASAAKIRAGAQDDATGIRDRLLADVRIEVQRIRGEAHADAQRIRAEARADADEARELAIAEMSADIQAVRVRLAADVESAARTACTLLSGRPPTPIAVSPVASDAADTAASSPGTTRASLKQVASEAQAAVVELQTATDALERSVRKADVLGGAEQRAATA
jgi:hypothetical protein